MRRLVGLDSLRYVDRLDDRNDIILQHWQQLAAASYAGYLERGRGAWMLDLKVPNYLALDSWLSGLNTRSADR